MITYAAYLGPDGYGTYEVDWSQGPPTRRIDRAADFLLVPGFVDIHIHGGFGIDFMTASSSDMLRLCDGLVEQGYEAFLPTTVTAPAEDVSRALSSMPAHPMIAGFHLEGPFISATYPGAQPPDHIAAPPSGLPWIETGWAEILDDPRLKVITLAPEVPGALDLIQRLAARGVTVSIGHTDATFVQCMAAHDAGAMHTTHTYNAMRPLHHREPGTVGFALAAHDVAAELIYDRIHVSTVAASILQRAKAPDKLIAVSDSSAATGLPDGSELNMWGHDCVLHGGAVTVKGSGALAGSTITLLDAFRNLYADFGPEIAIRACCLNPRSAIQLGEPTVYIGLNAEMQITQRWAAD